MMPKFAVFALRRMSAVTSFMSILYILAAVAAWMSCPLRKASIMFLSSLRCAMMRSSICE